MIRGLLFAGGVLSFIPPFVMISSRGADGEASQPATVGAAGQRLFGEDREDDDDDDDHALRSAPSPAPAQPVAPVRARARTRAS
jgi:hypothetical protein